MAEIIARTELPGCTYVVTTRIDSDASDTEPAASTFETVVISTGDDGLQTATDPVVSGTEDEAIDAHDETVIATANA